MFVPPVPAWPPVLALPLLPALEPPLPALEPPSLEPPSLEVPALGTLDLPALEPPLELPTEPPTPDPPAPAPPRLVESFFSPPAQLQSRSRDGRSTRRKSIALSSSDSHQNGSAHARRP
jgi:hypothetical protein